jgi:hypothetical protein
MPHRKQRGISALVIAAAIAAIAMLAVTLATAASAVAATTYPGYYMTQRQASWDAMTAAEAIYKKQHVVALSAKCVAQKGQHNGSKTSTPKYHRWVCTWHGVSFPSDAQGNQLPAYNPDGSVNVAAVGRPVTGKFIIAGNNGNFFSYWTQQGLRFV